jgi:protein-tyrosine phosphatase
MIRVLFVCLGNICRSPMAEAIFRKQVKREGLQDKFEVDSAGTGSWHVGEPPHEEAQKKLADYQVSSEGMKGRQIQEGDLDKFQYIIAMDAENLGHLHKIAGYDETGYIARLLDFVPGSETEDVPDPYFTGNFHEVYELIEEGCRELLAFIRKRESL